MSDIECKHCGRIVNTNNSATFYGKTCVSCGNPIEVEDPYWLKERKEKHEILRQEVLRMIREKIAKYIQNGENNGHK